MKLDDPLTCGTLTGTTFSLIPSLFWDDLLKTIILASLGALVSFTITFILQYLKSKAKRNH